MNTKVTLYALVIMCCGPLTALGDQFQLLAGTWVIDAEQTEKYLKTVGPPPHNANWIPAIFEYIEVFYNRQRRHQTLGYLSPVQFEQQAGVA